VAAGPAATEPQREPARRGLFRRALARTGAGLGALLLGRKTIDAELYEELETQLLLADVGVETCGEVIDELTARVKRGDLQDAGALREALRALLVERLLPCQQPLTATPPGKPQVILVVGVNGVGKTTTIGKLAHRLRQQGRSPILAAGDTFRAAAVEQLQIWGERNGVPVIAQGTGADSASVIFDAVQSAQARGLDVVIADTAGRLHTKDNLMAELAKVRRVMAKLDPEAPHETLLVLDAGTGQNAVVQMRQFSAAVPITGIALTKLDGTAKGGVIFALCREFGVPIRLVGLGEGIGDLQEFDAELFVDGLLAAPGA
jgi:fused signal recognition particle receptor